MSSPIRVLQVIAVMNRGGAETMIMNLYRNIDRTKVQFDFVENTFEIAAYDEEILSMGGKIYRCPHYTGKNHFQYKSWWKKFWNEHQKEYQIVHGHIGSTAAIYLQEAKKRGIYTIAHSHNTNARYNLKHFFYNILSYNTRHIADYFFACSKQAGLDRYGEKIINQENRYSILNNAILTKEFRYNEEIRTKIRKEFGFHEDDYVIGHIGRFSKQKNHAFLIDVFEEISKCEDNTKLLLVGDGVLRKEVEEKVTRLNLKNRVVFAGVRSDVANLLQGMDILLFPSLYEGLPVTLVEAQAAGLPCVISDAVPMDCIVTQNLISIQKLGDSKKNWATHVLNRRNEIRMDHANEVAENGFDIEQIAKELEEFYLEKIGLLKKERK